MNFERYTDRAKGFVQSAQSLALREGHQQFATEHLLKVLLDDPEGLASGLIDRAGGRHRDALAAAERAKATAEAEAAIAAAGDAIAASFASFRGLDRETVRKMRRDKFLAIGRGKL